MGSVPCFSPLDPVSSYIHLIAMCVCKARICSFAIKHRVVPYDIRGLFGYAQPSTGHSRRICRIIRSEMWRQVRYFRTCLKILAQGGQSHSGSGSQYRDYLLRASRMTEFFWWTYVPHLRNLGNQGRCTKGEPFTILGNIPLPGEIRKFLEKGLKIHTTPKVCGVQMIFAIRDISTKTQESYRPRCIDECMDVLMKVGPTPAPGSKTKI